MIYISGKITGDEIQEASAKFQAAADHIESEGGTAVNPMEMIEVEETKTWEDYMKEALIILMNCDQILMLEDWTESRGAKIEHALAKTLKFKIHYR